MQLLKKLTETPGVPGREERVRELIVRETKGLFDQVDTDPMGNLICLKRAGKTGKGKPPKVMLACHMDEIGFYVRYVDDQGFVRVVNVGGFDTRNLFSRRVLVQGKKDLIGVMHPAGKPVHIATDEERKKIPEIADLSIDLFRDKKEVEKLVSVGDPVTMIQEMLVIGDVVTGKAMDNRLAVWTGINTIKRIGNRSPYDVYFVATVQEEVGLRGATTSAFGIDPHVGIAVDGTLACDTPGVDKADAVCQLGKGVGLKVMDSSSISSRRLLDEFAALAKKNKIPYQLEILPRGGTDQGAIQRAGAGRETITLSVPIRYVHTTVESIHKSDLDAAVDLLSAWLTKNRAGQKA